MGQNSRHRRARWLLVMMLESYAREHGGNVLFNLKEINEYAKTWSIPGEWPLSPRTTNRMIRNMDSRRKTGACIKVSRFGERFRVTLYE